VRLNPSVAEARANLDIVQTARQRERELCIGVLPRLVPLVERVDGIASFAATASVRHLVIAQSLTPMDALFLEAVVAMAGQAPMRIWADARAGVADFKSACSVDYAAGLYPTGGMIVFFGTEFSPVEWLHKAGAQATLLVVTSDEPGLLLDRIRQLSAATGHRVGLLCCGAALARKLPFPTGIVAQAETTTRDSR